MIKLTYRTHDTGIVLFKQKGAHVKDECKHIKKNKSRKHISNGIGRGIFKSYPIPNDRTQEKAYNINFTI